MTTTSVGESSKNQARGEGGFPSQRGCFQSFPNSRGTQLRSVRVLQYLGSHNIPQLGTKDGPQKSGFAGNLP